jgi:hypothetical protein
VILAVDWVTVSKLAAAAATVGLALATFASVRSANRAARVVERSLRVGPPAVVLPTRPDDPQQTIAFADGRRLTVPGGGAVIELTDDAIQIAMAIRNVGGGLAILRGWFLQPKRAQDEHTEVEEFNRLACDVYLSGSETVVWQSRVKASASPAFARVRQALLARTPLSLEILHSNQHEDRWTITRFDLTSAGGDGKWSAAAAGHRDLEQLDLPKEQDRCRLAETGLGKG